MTISILKQNFTDIADLARSVMVDLVSNGFETVSTDPITDTTTIKAFKPSAAVDSLAATQPWRLRIECAGGLTGFIKINVATPLQIKDDDTVVSELTGITSGVLTKGVLAASDDFFKGSQVYPTGSSPYAHPLDYWLNISDHGITLVISAQGQENTAGKYSWFCIQRPVDNVTGTPLVTGKCPVFAVWSVGGGNGNAINAATQQDIYRMVVRESDISRPGQRVPATFPTEDFAAIINPVQQISIAEGNQYIITFPNNLNTQRFVYKHELDMIAYTSSDVVGHSATVALTVYGETTPRIYTAVTGNGTNNTGMRLLILTTGGGI